jgi:hypothetical protein
MLTRAAEQQFRYAINKPLQLSKRQIWTPSNRVPIKFLSKMAGRAAVAVGGATVGTVTYYSHKVSGKLICIT